MYKNITAIVNDPDVTLGTITSEIHLEYAWDVDWDTLPLSNKYIILGGHMGAYDTDKFPYLDYEKKWLKKAIENKTHILGICLGAQLIADSMGGRAYLANQIEFGFKNLEFFSNDTIYDSFKNLNVFTWHRDTFDLPPNAELIAQSDFPQIFTLNNVVALQFHPEIELELFNLWYSSSVSKHELKGYPVDYEVLYLKDNLSKLRTNMNEFLNRWIAL
jgi:GMP synthase-like glutamine amidotransferase